MQDGEDKPRTGGKFVMRAANPNTNSESVGSLLKNSPYSPQQKPPRARKSPANSPAKCVVDSQPAGGESQREAVEDSSSAVCVCNNSAASSPWNRGEGEAASDDEEETALPKCKYTDHIAEGLPLKEKWHEDDLEEEDDLHVHAPREGEPSDLASPPVSQVLTPQEEKTRKSRARRNAHDILLRRKCPPGRRELAQKEVVFSEEPEDVAPILCRSLPFRRESDKSVSFNMSVDEISASLVELEEAPEGEALGTEAEYEEVDTTVVEDKLDQEEDLDVSSGRAKASLSQQGSMARRRKPSRGKLEQSENAKDSDDETEKTDPSKDDIITALDPETLCEVLASPPKFVIEASEFDAEISEVSARSPRVHLPGLDQAWEVVLQRVGLPEAATVKDEPPTSPLSANSGSITPSEVDSDAHSSRSGDAPRVVSPGPVSPRVVSPGPQSSPANEAPAWLLLAGEKTRRLTEKCATGVSACDELDATRDVPAQEQPAWVSDLQLKKVTPPPKVKTNITQEQIEQNSLLVDNTTENLSSSPGKPPQPHDVNMSPGLAAVLHELNTETAENGKAVPSWKAEIESRKRNRTFVPQQKPSAPLTLGATPQWKRDLAERIRQQSSPERPSSSISPTTISKTATTESEEVETPEASKHNEINSLKSMDNTDKSCVDYNSNIFSSSNGKPTINGDVIELTLTSEEIDSPPPPPWHQEMKTLRKTYTALPT